MMAHFSYLPRRDAYATIRGFVYQVDQTLQKWLTLGEDQTIELECGEDVDTISRTFQVEERLLSQVKGSMRAVSLKSPEALASIANFVAHRKQNPQLTIYFEYITTASVAKERPQIFSHGYAGITVWNGLNRSDLELSDRSWT